MVSAIDRTQLIEETQQKFAGKGDFSFQGSDGFASPLSGRVLAAPALLASLANEDDLNGKFIGAVQFENPSAKACLPDGFYRVHLSKESDVWTAGFIDISGKIINSTTNVKLKLTNSKPDNPEVLAMESSSLLLVFVVGFGLGVAVGIQLGARLAAMQ